MTPFLPHCQQSPDNIPGLRISIIDANGKIVYDNSLDSLPGTNHLDRKEIAEAMKRGEGYALRRHSESTGGTYFYAAKRGDGYVVRSAMPYNVSLNQLLAADYAFLWVMIVVTIIMCIIGFFATRRVGRHIGRLNRFAESAERGERIFDTEPFPHDELGDISNNIVRLYARLQQAITDRDHERPPRHSRTGREDTHKTAANQQHEPRVENPCSIHAGVP